MWRTDSFEKTLMLGKIDGRRRRGHRGWDGWMTSQTQWTWVWLDSGSWWWTGRPGMLQLMGSQRVGHNWATELNWTDARKDWGQEEKGTTEDELVGWHCHLNGHEFEWTQGCGDGHGSLACCNPWGNKELDMTEQLNWREGGKGFCKWEFSEISHYRKTKCMSPLIWDCLEKALMLGKIEGRRRRGQQDEMVGWHQWFMNMSLSKFGEMVKNKEAYVLQSMGSQRVRHDWVNKNHIVKFIKFKCEILVPEAKAKGARRVDNQSYNFSSARWIYLHICFNSTEKVEVEVKSLSHVWLFATPWTVAYQTPPSMKFKKIFTMFKTKKKKKKKRLKSVIHKIIWKSVRKEFKRKTHK